MSWTSAADASSTWAASSSWSCAAGSCPASRERGSGVWRPETTSSPWPRGRYSPYGVRSPVSGLRVKRTPVPERSSRLPNTIAWTVTAVGTGAPGVAGVEHRRDRQQQLLFGVGGDFPARVPPDDLPERGRVGSG